VRTEERLRKLQEWTYNTVCRGREMKAPAPGMDIRQVARQEPRVFLGYAPQRPDLGQDGDPLNVAPGIILAPLAGDVHNADHRSHDDRDVRRSMEMSQSLSVQMIFIVYEDGVRLPGFTEVARESAYPMELIREGTEEGLLTLCNWMDDFKDALLSEGRVPGTDLVVNDEVFDYGWMTDQKTISDRRPYFIGMVTVKFQCHADRFNQEIHDLLK